MKRTQFADSQIMAILKQAETGTPIPELCREHGVSLLASRVTRFLEQLAETHGHSGRIRVDNGPDFTSQTFMTWAERHIVIDFIEYGCSYQNA